MYTMDLVWLWCVTLNSGILTMYYSGNVDNGEGGSAWQDAGCMKNLFIFNFAVILKITRK